MNFKVDQKLMPLHTCACTHRRTHTQGLSDLYANVYLKNMLFISSENNKITCTAYSFLFDYSN